ncbi:MAG: putative toxin-antitoxin system toxin component, PIN family [Candidatus Aenigmarchaeota archaeon]|nr:putative toxin-antitoxin system toxin component, PIN family [Candidatus Aenigmarchaeota archaeon]
MKLVLDTNTIISGFLWKGNEFHLIKKIEEEKIELFLTEEILEEIKDVISRKKFEELLKEAELTPEDILTKVTSMAKIIEPIEKLNVVKDDPDDNKFLECAISCKANYIISGDKHLLKLKEYEKIPIIRTSKILKIIKENS